MSDSGKNQEDNQKDKVISLDQLALDIKNILNTQLSGLITTLLNSAHDTLFNISQAADNNEDQSLYFDLSNQVRTLKDEIIIDFIINTKHYQSANKNFSSKQQKHNSGSDDDEELSLVGRDDMEGIVLVKGIGERSNAKYSELLSQLEARLNELAKNIKTCMTLDALNPTNYCQAFDDALANNFNTENKKILFGMFDTGVANNLGDLYETINQRLIEAGILPKIKLHVSKNTTSSTQPNNADSEQQANASDNESENENFTDGQDISGFARTAAPGKNYQNNNGQQQSPGSAQENNANTSVENGEYQHYTAGIPASKVGRILSNYIGAPYSPENDGAPSSDSSELFPQSTQQHFGHEEIIQALSNIQSQPQFNQEEGARLNSEDIKQAVLSAIAKTSGGAVTKRINQIAEKTIDFIELIFDAIIDDKEISDTIKTLLLRLQIPIIKASMSDQKFFIYDEHPARLLLDAIADASTGVTEHSDSTYKFIDKIISNILAEYDLNTEIFQNALDKLNAHTEEQNALTRAKEEVEQRQLLRKHARATVLKSLRATTTGKTLPEEVHALILKRWPTLMFNHYLSNGKENNEWVNIVLTLRYIVDSVQVITSAEDLAKLISRKDALFAKTEDYLNVSSNSKKDVLNVMDVYKETVHKHIEDANFTTEEVDAAEEIINNAEPIEEPPVEEEVTDRPTIPSNIMPGMWFQLYMGEDKNVRRCKLSVILVEDANLMFVNHKGELIAEKSFDEFNEEIANESTKIIMGHSAFENAFKTVINRLN